jgi:hypothetical protein
MADQIFPKGVRLFNKHEKAPEFVIGSLVITLNELVQFCKDNPSLLTEYNGQKQLKLQIVKTKSGNLSATVDTYKKEEKTFTETKEDLPF